MVLSEAQIEAVDPRVRRTRLMLHEALEKLLPEKEFDKISVQDIVDKATLHRATFYDHYADKFALLECVVAVQFRGLLAKREVSFTGCEGALRAIAQGVCDFISNVPGVACQRELERHMEAAVIAVVRRMILDGMEKHGTVGVKSRLVASTISWAIYGAAKEWMHMDDRWPAELAAEKIEELVRPLMVAAH